MRRDAAFKTSLWADDDIVDGDVDQLDEESDEAHDGESDGGGDSDLLELCKKLKNWQFRRYFQKCRKITFLVGFGAPLDQSDGVFGELLQRFNGLDDLIHDFLDFLGVEFGWNELDNCTWKF